jgi:hypothetical protein
MKAASSLKNVADGFLDRMVASVFEGNRESCFVMIACKV